MNLLQWNERLGQPKSSLRSLFMKILTRLVLLERIPQVAEAASESSQCNELYELKKAMSELIESEE